MNAINSAQPETVLEVSPFYDEIEALLGRRRNWSDQDLARARYLLDANGDFINAGLSGDIDEACAIGRDLADAIASTKPSGPLGRLTLFDQIGDPAYGASNSMWPFQTHKAFTVLRKHLLAELSGEELRGLRARRRSLQRMKAKWERQYEARKREQAATIEAGADAACDFLVDHLGSEIDKFFEMTDGLPREFVERMKARSERAAA